jgi:hypothetical protein
MIISIGIDCKIASFLKLHNLRHIAFPFDWTVTYNGVSKCIDDNFKFFTEPLHNRINNYDIYFHHDFEDKESYIATKEKYDRRCQRLINILETTTEYIIFCRKGHAQYHHYEHNNISNDIDDAEQLNIILSTKYPQLVYTIIVILDCDKCFNSNKIYKSNSDKIEIYNLNSGNITLDDCCRTIFNI